MFKFKTVTLSDCYEQNLIPIGYDSPFVAAINDKIFVGNKKSMAVFDKN